MGLRAMPQMLQTRSGLGSYKSVYSRPAFCISVGSRWCGSANEWKEACETFSHGISQGMFSCGQKSIFAQKPNQSAFQQEMGRIHKVQTHHGQ